MDELRQRLFFVGERLAFGVNVTLEVLCSSDVFVGIFGEGVPIHFRLDERAPDFPFLGTVFAFNTERQVPHKKPSFWDAPDDLEREKRHLMEIF